MITKSYILMKYRTLRIYLCFTLLGLFAARTLAVETLYLVEKVPIAPNRPNSGLGWDGTHFWISNWYGNDVHVVDPLTGNTVRTVTLQTRLPRGYDEATDDQWINGEWWHADGLGCITKMEPVTETVISTLNVGTSNPQGLAWDGSHLWYTDNDTQRLYRLADLVFGQKDLTYNLPLLTSDASLDFHAGKLWLARALRVFRIDPATGLPEAEYATLDPGDHPSILCWAGDTLWGLPASGNSLAKYSFAASPATTECLYDDFNDGDLTANPAWQIIGNGPYFSVEQGALVYRGSSAAGHGEIQLPQTAAYGQWRWKRRVTGGGGWGNQRVRFVALDVQNFYEVRMDNASNGDQIHLWRSIEGVEQELASAAYGADHSAWNEITVTRDQAGLMRVYVAGALRLEAADTVLNSSRYFYVWMQENGAGVQPWIDDIYGPCPSPTIRIERPSSGETWGWTKTVPIEWCSGGIAAPVWKFFLDRNNVFDRQLLLNPVEAGGGCWHADFTVPTDLAYGCDYTVVVKDDSTGTDAHSQPFCIGLPINIQTALTWPAGLISDDYDTLLIANTVGGPWRAFALSTLPGAVIGQQHVLLVDAADKAKFYRLGKRQQ